MVIKLEDFVFFCCLFSTLADHATEYGDLKPTSNTRRAEMSFSAIHVLAAGDELNVTTSGSADYYATAADTIFSGYLIG